DELGELDKSMQVKLLRFLESGEIRRVGDNEQFNVDVRIVCATNRDLQEMVAAGTFREDLFFRVNTFEVYLPPLRERLDDIPALALHLIARHLKRDVVDADMLPDATVRKLKSHHWSGNVRELSNVLEHAVILSDGEPIAPEDLPRSVNGHNASAAAAATAAGPTIVPFTAAASAPMTLREMETRMILAALDRHSGDKPAAARDLGIALKTLYNRLNQIEAERNAG
ncbi:MAG: sigma 54-interacting transcriptional regulator, partial [Planctomycetaceae bacterium]|nr:sigma 54-interacting transcriptional regulator [Planctomycetaceae bacterium]